MKALSVRQPWAQNIADGDKTIEIRLRKWSYRGPLVICAAHKFWLDEFGGDKRGDPLPHGCTVCTVDMIDCRPLTPEDAEAAGLYPGDLPPEDCEGRWAWVLANAQPVLPLPVKGQLQPWDWKGPEPVPAPKWEWRRDPNIG